MLLVDPSHSGQRRGLLLLSLTSCSAVQVCAGVNYFSSSLLYKIKILEKILLPFYGIGMA